MSDAMIVLLFGLTFAAAGVFLFIRERRLFRFSTVTQARVTGYYEYQNPSPDGGYHTMYSMEVEYTLPRGSVINAREQAGSNRKKYAAGDEITIVYSNEKPDFFTARGDHSRIIAIVGLIIVGFAMLPLAGYIAFLK